MESDEQFGGSVVELLAGLFADLHPRRLATRTNVLGFGQVVNDRLANQIGGQSLPPVALFLRPPGRLGVLGNRRGFQRGGGFRGTVEEIRLIGPEGLGLRAVEPTQELIESLLHAAQFSLTTVQQGEQFANHSLERLGIVGQRGLIGKCVEVRRVGSGGVRAHAIKTRHAGNGFTKCTGGWGFITTRRDRMVSLSRRGSSIALLAFHLGGINALQHQLQVGGRHLDLHRITGRHRQRKTADFQPLVKNREAVDVPPDHFETVARLVAEDEQAVWLGRVVMGYFRYFAIPGNIPAMESFRTQVVRYWLRALRRRSQRHRLSWEVFGPRVNRVIPRPRVLHDHPNLRFYAKHPR